MFAPGCIRPRPPAGVSEQTRLRAGCAGRFAWDRFFIARDDPDRALSFVDELEASCSTLTDYPSLGRKRPELGPDLRSKPHGSYVIFYSVSGPVVRIERILHGSRDLDQALRKK